MSRCTFLFFCDKILRIFDECFMKNLDNGISVLMKNLDNVISVFRTKEENDNLVLNFKVLKSKHFSSSNNLVYTNLLAEFKAKKDMEELDGVLKNNLNEKKIKV